MTKIFFSCMIILCCFACKTTYVKYASNYTFKSENGLPNYGNLNYWAAHPWKHDTSDSVPKPLRKDFNADSTIDVFFLHPTSYSGKEKTQGWNAPIDDSLINAKTDYSSILYQASVFNNVGRVFAPRYRQANYFAYLPTTKEDTLKALAAFDTAYADIQQAFDYYLNHYNNGRPIIIAAHSQGTTHAKRLLKEYFDGKLLQNKLVVAYLVGMPVENDYFKNIQPCDNENQTNCFCTWRTFKVNYTPDYLAKENNKVVVTNPLTWNVNIPSAEVKDNKGSVLKNFNQLVPKVTNATVHNGIIWAKHPRFFGSFLLRAKNYHIADYNFYYLSIRENVANRIKMFWKK